MDNNNWMQQLLMLGIGTTSVMADKLKEASEQLVKDGKLDPEQAKAVMDDMVEGLKSEQGNWDKNMQRQMKNVYSKIDQINDELGKYHRIQYRFRQRRINR
ncbi:MAG: hypothetical protein MJK14_29030 [Rivularia sp. ALOHA_DT_140]|nr:hypothetical protein [Rivularia sp. ALOHA_DT_140]